MSLKFFSKISSIIPLNLSVTLLTTINFSVSKKDFELKELKNTSLSDKISFSLLSFNFLVNLL